MADKKKELEKMKEELEREEKILKGELIEYGTEEGD